MFRRVLDAALRRRMHARELHEFTSHANSIVDEVSHSDEPDDCCRTVEPHRR